LNGKGYKNEIYMQSDLNMKVNLPVLHSLKLYAIIVFLISTSFFANAGVTQTLSIQCITEKPCKDKPLPKWEVGVAGISVNAPIYPTSNSSISRSLIVPYFIYRGEIFNVGEGGLIKAKGFEDKRWKLDLSLDAAFNADSDNNKAREGMDDLDYLFGIGPELTYEIIPKIHNDQKLELKLQLRGVFSTDFSNIKQRGYAFETKLRYEQEHIFHHDIKFVGSIGPIWGTEKMMDYFFQIEESDVLPTRAKFDAQSGYLGTEINLGLVMSVMEQKGKVFLGIRTSLHQGATNKGSALFQRDTTTAMSAGFTYRLFESTKVQMNK
jgi:hypothetical protein